MPMSTDDVVVDETDDHEDAAAAVKKLRETLSTCKKERKEYLDGWKRAKADALNEKKRQQRLLTEERNLAISHAVASVMPLLDSIRSARVQLSEKEAKQLGIEHMYTQCFRSLEDLDVIVLDPVGESFDPHQHQSIGERPVDEKGSDGTVVEVAQVGAVLGNHVIRAPLVYVGSYKPQKKHEEK